MSGKVKTQAKAPVCLAPAPPAFQSRPFVAQLELAFGEERDASSLMRIENNTIFNFISNPLSHKRI